MLVPRCIIVFVIFLFQCCWSGNCCIVRHNNISLKILNKTVENILTSYDLLGSLSTNEGCLLVGGRICIEPSLSRSIGQLFLCLVDDADFTINSNAVSDFYKGILSNYFFMQTMYSPIRSVFDHYFPEQKGIVYRVLKSYFQVHFDYYSHKRIGDQALWKIYSFYSVWENSKVWHRGKLRTFLDVLQSICPCLSVLY